MGVFYRGFVPCMLRSTSANGIMLMTVTRSELHRRPVMRRISSNSILGSRRRVSRVYTVV